MLHQRTNASTTAALGNGRHDRLSASAVGDIGIGPTDHEQSAIGIESNVPCTTEDLRARIKAPLFASALIDALSSTTAMGLYSLPSRSRSIVRVMSLLVRNSSQRTRRRNHQYTVCQGRKSAGNIGHPPPVRARLASRKSQRSVSGLWPRATKTAE